MLRVAVAEDNPKDRERLLSFLKQYGEEKHVQIEVTEYTDGSELLEQYRPCYDVIFLDVEMPQMDGMKAAEKIRETGVFRKNGQGKPACGEEKRQEHCHQNRYCHAPYPAFSYPVCGGGSAPFDLPHRGRGFFHTRRAQGCGSCAGREWILQMQQVLSGESSPCAKRS